jgi:hypothetical protein
MLRNELGSLVFLSDMQKCRLEGVKELFPGAPHAYCLRHLQENFHKKFKNSDKKNELSHLLWNAARANTEADFEKCLQDMKAINSESVDWLLQTTYPKHWTDLYFEGSDMVISRQISLKLSMPN